MRTASIPALVACRRLWCVALGMCAAPALAMSQCPPEFGPKSIGFVAAGWGVLALFCLAGSAVPWLLWRRTRSRPMRVRLALGALALFVMLALWCAGLLIWLGVFVLPC